MPAAAVTTTVTGTTISPWVWPGDNPGAGNAGSVNVLYGDQGGLTANGAQIWNRKNTQIVGIPRANAALGTAVACGDFNADGFTDLAAGAPGDESGRGSVMVLFGSASGLTVTSDQRWEQDTVGVLSAGEPGDRFGTALTSGDFNGDGFADLAIGAPGEGSARGGVNVLFGGAGGLSAGGDAFLQQGGGGVDGIRRAGEEFGAALAAGDFDGDGIDDLAIGTPGEELSGKRDSGSVLVIEGSPAGLDTGADNIWHQDVSGVEGSAEAGDRFGESVAAGDFNSDGYDDLAIGAPDEDRSDITMAGSAQIIHGSNDGLTSSGDLRVFQGVGGVNGIAQEGDRFGASVAAGDFDGDGYDDLAIGSPGEDNEAGMASVLYGSTGSIDGSRDQLWKLSTAGVLGNPKPGDALGIDVASGDFDGDGFLDLAIGTPGADRSGAPNSGAAHVLYGSKNRINAIGDQSWHQDKDGVPGIAAAGDALGSTAR